MHLQLVLYQELILTVGMAVDANVLIFERIKEELKDETNNIFSAR